MGNNRAYKLDKCKCMFAENGRADKLQKDIFAWNNEAYKWENDIFAWNNRAGKSEKCWRALAGNGTGKLE